MADLEDSDDDDDTAAAAGAVVLCLLCCCVLILPSQVPRDADYSEQNTLILLLL